jgi:hypothetical protein
LEMDARAPRLSDLIANLVPTGWQVRHVRRDTRIARASHVVVKALFPKVDVLGECRPYAPWGGV